MEDEKDAGTQNDEQPQPTTEEQLATLTTQLEAKDADTQKALSRVQGLEGSLKEKDRLLKEQANIETRFGGIEDSIQILAGLVSKGDLTPEEAQDYKKEFATVKKARDEERAESQARARQEVYNTDANALFARAKVSVADKKDLKMVEVLLTTGDLKGAEELVTEAESSKEVKPVETEAEMEARILKKLQADDRKTETGMPTGGNSSDEDFVKKFASGELPATKANADRYEKIRDSY